MRLSWVVVVLAVSACAELVEEPSESVVESELVSSGSTTPRKIEDGAGSVLWPKIAVDADGVVTAVWIQDWNAWSNRYRPGVGWGTATLLESAAGDVKEIAVAAGKKVTTVVWTQLVNGVPATFAARNDGTTWSARTQISGNLAGNGTSNPVVAMDHGDNAYTAWIHHEGGHYTVWSRTRTPTSWAAVARRSLATQEASKLVASAAPNGNACVAWIQSIPGSNGNGFDGYVMQAAPTTWSAPVLFETRFAQMGEVECGAFGDAAKTLMVAYRQWDGVQVDDFYARTYAAGTGLGTEALLDGDSVAGHSVDQIQLAVDGWTNVAFVTWDQHDGTNWRGYGRRYASGAWGTTTAFGVEVRPWTLAANHEGKAVMAYLDKSTANWQVKGMRWTGSAWTSFDPKAAASAGEWEPQIVLDDAGNLGNATVLWHEHDGQSYNAWTSRQLAVDVDGWIDTTPNIASAINWQFRSTAVATVPAGDKKAWTAWTAAEKTQLRTAVWNEWAWWFGTQAPLSSLGETMADPPANLSSGGDWDYHTTQISAVDARALYIATIGHTLFVELGGLVPWSITGYDLATLRGLLDSAALMRFDTTTGRYELAGVTTQGPYAKREDNLGFSMLSPPRGTFARVTGASLVGTTRIDSIGRLLEWMRAKMRHAYAPSGAPGGSSSFFGAEHTWGYRGAPPFSRIFDGTTNTTPNVWGSPDYFVEWAFDNWTGGCHHTTAFMQNALRSINIPVVELRYCGHAEVLFPTESKYLDHADDPYSGPMVSHPEIAASSLLLDHATFVARFGSNPDNNCDSNQSQWIGRRVEELVPP